jgi:MOSC domain-containing protein YiiM
VSLEELALIAECLGGGAIDPALLGANITFSGMIGFTALPKGSQIWFPDRAILTVEGENSPCIGPGKEIAKVFSHVQAAEFPKAAQKLRGLVGVVHRAGAIKVGDIAHIVVAV